MSLLYKMIPGSFYHPFLSLYFSFNSSRSFSDDTRTHTYVISRFYGFPLMRFLFFWRKDEQGRMMIIISHTLHYIHSPF